MIPAKNFIISGNTACVTILNTWMLLRSKWYHRIYPICCCLLMMTALAFAQSKNSFNWMDQFDKSLSEHFEQLGYYLFFMEEDINLFHYCPSKWSWLRWWNFSFIPPGRIWRLNFFSRREKAIKESKLNKPESSCSFNKYEVPQLNQILSKSSVMNLVGGLPWLCIGSCTCSFSRFPFPPSATYSRCIKQLANSFVYTRRTYFY